MRTQMSICQTILSGIWNGTTCLRFVYKSRAVSYVVTCVRMYAVSCVLQSGQIVSCATKWTCWCCRHCVSTIEGMVIFGATMWRCDLLSDASGVLIVGVVACISLFMFLVLTAHVCSECDNVCVLWLYLMPLSLDLWVSRYRCFAQFA